MWLTVGWWVAWCSLTSKSRLKWLNWLVLTDCMAGGSLLCLAGRWLVDWFWQRDWQNVWLTVGWWVACYFLLQNRDWITDWLVLSISLTAWLTLGNQNTQLRSERPVHEYGTSNQGIKHIESSWSDHISRSTEGRTPCEFSHIWSHSTRMFVRFIPRQWIVDVTWWMLPNSLHRRAMSNDCRFVKGMIACSKSQMVRFVITFIDYDGLNMYLTI